MDQHLLNQYCSNSYSSSSLYSLFFLTGIRERSSNQFPRTENTNCNWVQSNCHEFHLRFNFLVCLPMTHQPTEEEASGTVTCKQGERESKSKALKSRLSSSSRFIGSIMSRINKVCEKINRINATNQPFGRQLKSWGCEICSLGESQRQKQRLRRTSGRIAYCYTTYDVSKVDPRTCHRGEVEFEK